jgi:phage regulator Rha-like protein
LAKASQHKTNPNADEEIISSIYFARGQKVMLDYDLAALYQVETRRLNEQVKRNISRFPEDFMFRLTKQEWNLMRSHFATPSQQTAGKQNDPVISSQIAIASQSKRNTAVTPYAFTEHGVTMLASVLKSERAVKMSIAIVRAFIELKNTASQFKELAAQLEQIKMHIGQHDAQLNTIYEAIENLVDDKAKKQTWENRLKIGFKLEE